MRPGGVFITAALRRCRHYVVGGKRFPSADVDEYDMHAVLAPRFGAVEARKLAEHARTGLLGDRARYGHSTPTSVGSGSS